MNIYKQILAWSTVQAVHESLPSVTMPNAPPAVYVTMHPLTCSSQRTRNRACHNAFLMHPNAFLNAPQQCTSQCTLNSARHNALPTVHVTMHGKQCMIQRTPNSARHNAPLCNNARHSAPHATVHVTMHLHATMHFTIHPQQCMKLVCLYLLRCAISCSLFACVCIRINMYAYID